MKRVVIDSKLLRQFKQRAFRKYPKEYARALVGFIQDDSAYICAMLPVTVNESDEDGIDFETDEEYGTAIGAQVAIGSIHTHPDSYCEPSDTDVEDAKTEHELVMGILALEKSGRKRITSLGFFTSDGKPLEVFISE